MLGYVSLLVDDRGSWVKYLAIKQKEELEDLTHIIVHVSSIDQVLLVESCYYHQDEAIRAESTQERRVEVVDSQEFLEEKGDWF